MTPSKLPSFLESFGEYSRNINIYIAVFGADALVYVFITELLLNGKHIEPLISKEVVPLLSNLFRRLHNYFKDASIADKFFADFLWKLFAETAFEPHRKTRLIT